MRVVVSMDWSGKNTQKMHIRLTEDVAREVRATADLDHRPIQDQLRFLIVLGLQAVRDRVEGNRSKSRRAVPPNAAPEEIRNDLQISPAPPRAAIRRTTPQKNRRLC